MNYFEFCPNDQVRNNWLLFIEQNEPPWVLLKSRYHGCVCSKCRKVDHDKAFAEGFDDSLKFHAKGDFFGTADGFICINDKVKLVIEARKFQGVNIKPVLNTGLWVLKVTCRVNSDQNAYVVRNQCDQCGHARQTYGKICCLNQIESPAQCEMFFSPKIDRSGTMGRDLFVTEDIVTEFKKQGFKGGLFSRLLTPLEYEGVKAANAIMDPLRWPKGSRIVL